MRDEEFIFIDGRAVRLTSARRDGERLSIVIIVRGSGGRDELQQLLGRDAITIALGDDAPRRMRAADVDLRSSGSGATAIYRFAIALEPAPAPTAPATPAQVDDLEQRLTRIERKLDTILARLDAG